MNDDDPNGFDYPTKDPQRDPLFVTVLLLACAGLVVAGAVMWWFR